MAISLGILNALAMPWLKQLQKTVSDYFFFTKGQRLAFAILLLAMVGVVVFRSIVLQKSRIRHQPADDVVINTLNDWKPYEKSGDKSEEINYSASAQWQIPDGDPLTTTKFSLHPFDPNTVSAEELLAMGFRPKSVQTLVNYRSKGGRFRKPEDILKMYGLFPDEKELILPYVVITNEEKPKDTAAYQNTYRPKKPATVVVSINNADTAAWKALPGIGEKLSARIVNFRDKLGGFYSIEQIGETYALPDSTFQKIKPMLQLDEHPLRKLNFNTADYNLINSHPYINSKQARFIVNYRQQHNGINDASILLQTPELFNEEWLNKIRPYLDQ